MRSLYVSRDLLNPEPLIAWARLNGFNTCLQPSEMHVTVLYSKAAFDTDLVKPDQNAINCRGGLRYLDVFGPTQDTAVLVFECPELKADNAMYRAAGGSSDYPDYKAHVTITLNIPESLDVKALKPYAGDLKFGPEVWAEPGSGSNTDKVEKDDLVHDDLKTGGGLLNAEQAGESKAVTRRKRRPFIEWIKKFNENHDEKGRFASGGSAPDGTETQIDIKGIDTEPAKAEMERQYNEKAMAAQSVADALGLPRDKFNTSTEQKTFELDGHQYSYAGACELATGQVTIYPNQCTLDNIGGVVAHEIGHVHFEAVTQAYSKDTQAIIADPRDVIRASGELRDEYRKEFPVYAMLQPVMEDQKKLREDDGVTPYSTTWWDSFNKGVANAKQAMHETFAEIHAMAAKTSASNRTTYLKDHGVKPSWRTLYARFEKVYEGLNKS